MSPNPSEYQNKEDFMGVCVPKLIGENKTDEEARVACNAMWEKRESSYSVSDLFTDLSLSEDKKHIDGLAAGTFRDMHGRQVTFTTEDLEKYVEETQAILESTKDSEGRIVGLPIDKKNHDRQGGAGWITGLKLDKGRNIVQFAVNWTKEGAKQITENVTRFFSPSVNPSLKTITGGSLTNYPATRTSTGKFILRPVELSQSMQTFKEINMSEKTNEQLEADLAALQLQLGKLQSANADLTAKLSKKTEGLAEDEITPEMAEFISGIEGAEKIGKEAQMIAYRAVKDERRKREVRDFVASVIGGTADKPFGIPVNSAEFTAALLGLPDKQRKFMQGVILKLYDGAIDFAKHGYSGDSIFAQGKRVPSEFTQNIQMWVDSGKTAQSWFEEVGADLGLGEAKDYNLSMFKSVKQESDEE